MWRRSGVLALLFSCLLQVEGFVVPLHAPSRSIMGNSLRIPHRFSSSSSPHRGASYSPLDRGLPHGGPRVRRSVGVSMQLKPQDGAAVEGGEGGEAGEERRDGGPQWGFLEGLPLPQSFKDNPGPWAAVALLLGINIHNQWTRALVYYLVSFKADPSLDASKQLYMNVDLGFDEAQYSLLASFAFTLLYTVASLFAGRAADKFDRAKVLVAATALWSLSTCATALAVSFDNVAALRGILGVSQAFVGPQAYGLIASLFSGQGLATANSVYASGVYVGGALASLSILLDQQLGWRDTNLVAGVVGLALAGAMGVALKDPRSEEGGVRGEEKGSSKEEKEIVVSGGTSVMQPAKVLPVEEGEGGKGEGGSEVLGGAVDAVKGVVGNRFVQYLFVAAGLRFCAGYGIGVWKAPFFREAFPDFASEFSVANAFIISGGGILSSLLGGVISDKYSKKDQRVSLWVPAVGSLLAVPLWYGTVHADSFYTSMGLLFGEYIVAECWFGPVVASLYKAVPKEVQGTAQGLFTVLTAVGNAMPVLIGSLQSQYGLPDVLAYAVGAAYIGSGVFFFIAGEHMPKEQAVSQPKSP